MDSPFPPDGASHPAADRTLRLPMRLLGRTIARTREALAGLEPGAVLCVRTDDP